MNLPRRAALAKKDLPTGDPNPRSGLGRIKDFSVITELKVSATQIEGLDYTEVVRDFQKLSAILNAAENQYKGTPLPRAFVGVFNNHKHIRFNFEIVRSSRVVVDQGAELSDDLGRLAHHLAGGCF